MTSHFVPKNEYNAIFYKISELGFITSNPNVLFISCHIISSYGLGYILILYLHLEHVSWSFNICHLTFGDKLYKFEILTFGTSYPKLWRPTCLSNYLKDHLLIGLDLSASRNLDFNWIINPSVLLRSKPHLGFDLPYSDFYCAFRIRIRISFLHLSFLNFYPKTDTTFLNSTVIGISSFDNRLSNPFSSTSF